MSRRTLPCWTAAFVLFCAAFASDAVAEQFSYNCVHAGTWDVFTFDDTAKRVIGYGFGPLRAFFTGTISAITPEEIHFDLVLPFDKIQIGSFTLNRKENWMTSLRFPGRTDLRDPCHLGPPRPVLDLWPVMKPQQ